MIDTEELRRLAQAATPGPWEVYGLDQHGQAIIKGEHIEIATCWHHCVESIEKEMRANAALIAAANPAAVLELLDRLEATERERDALRAKIAEMDKQEPVGWLLEGNFYEVRQMSLYKDNEPLPDQTALYALPGAQPQLNEIKTNLQRALELGQREPWTGARKHRSREDQREEQQCWNKVWSLLGAKGDRK